MSQSKHHAMQLINTYSSGAEEWYCPSCERQFIMHVHSKSGRINMVILETGDQFTPHSGSKGGLRITGIQTQPNDEIDEETILSEDLRNALDDVLKNLDFGD